MGISSPQKPPKIAPKFSKSSSMKAPKAKISSSSNVKGMCGK